MYDLLLADGDFVRAGEALRRASGATLWRQNLLIALATPKGSFAPNPQLGSELHLLRNLSGRVLQDAVQAAVSDVLQQFPGVSLREFRAAPRGDRLDLRFIFAREGAPVALGVTV